MGNSAHPGCEKCGEKTAVVEGYSKSNFQLPSGKIDLIGLNNIYRRRKRCSSCAHSFTTYEIVREDFYELSKRIFLDELHIKIKVLKAFLADFFPDV